MRKKNQRFNQNKIYIAICVISVIVILWLIIDMSLPEKKRPVINQLESEEVDKETTSSKYVIEKVEVETDVIKEELEAVGKLTTAEYYFTQVETYSKTKSYFGIWSAESEFIFSYDGVVSAGIDFSKIKVEKDEDNNKITVIIPNATIQYTEIYYDSFKKYLEDESIWNKLDIDDYNKSMKDFESSANKKAKDNKIIENANDNALIIIKNLVDNLLSDTDYKIEYVLE